MFSDRSTNVRETVSVLLPTLVRTHRCEIAKGVPRLSQFVEDSSSMYRWKNVKVATRVLHSRRPMEALRSLLALSKRLPSIPSLGRRKPPSTRRWRTTCSVISRPFARSRVSWKTSSVADERRLPIRTLSYEARELKLIAQSWGLTPAKNRMPRTLTSLRLVTRYVGGLQRGKAISCLVRKARGQFAIKSSLLATRIG